MANDPRIEHMQGMMKAAMDALTDAFPGCGIVLLICPDLDAPEKVANYISNGRRADVVALLREVAGRLDGTAHPAPKAKQ